MSPLVNSHAGHCYDCTGWVPAGTGRIEKRKGRRRGRYAPIVWRVVHAECPKTSYLPSVEPLARAPKPFEFRGAPLSELP